MLNWLKKWWSPEPVYSEAGQRLWELLQKPEEWESSPNGGQKLRHRPTGIGIEGGLYNWEVWTWQSQLGVRVGVNDSSWGWIRFTKDDHKRLFRVVADIVHQRTAFSWEAKKQQAEKEVRQALGLETKQ